MRILLTNDDGIDSVGLHVLARAMRPFGDVVIAAPDREFSGAGAALGALHLIQPELHKAHVDGIDEAWALTGPPALCVMMAHLGILDKKFDLIVSGINKGWNRIEHHDTLVALYEGHIPKVSEGGFQNLICFSGNREKMDDQQGLENCAKGLKRIVGLAEKRGVTLVMELLNSKVNHKDYMCDHTAWGVELCKRVGSANFKLLYDIYHMQIMEGDVIRTLRESAEHIAHYHTGGNPGRNEFEPQDEQELNYPAIMRAIKGTGYRGFVGQEFLPKRDPLTSLRAAVKLCTV